MSDPNVPSTIQGPEVIANTGPLPVIEEVARQTSQSASEVLLSASDFLGNLSRAHEELLIGEDGIYILINTNTVTTLIPLINKIVENGFYIRGLNTSTIQKFIENPSESSSVDRIKIGAEVLPFSPNIEALAWWISWEKDEVFYKPDTALPPPNVYEFLGILWKSQVRFGFSWLDMELMLKNWKNVHQRIRIARPIPALDGIDAKEIYRVPTKPKRGLKATGPKDRVDMKLYECTFPQVSLTEGVRILIEKQPKEPGKEGLKVTGEKIPARELQDLDIQRLIGSGVFHTIQNDRECIATNQSGFISVDPKDERISVTEAAVGHDVIGPKTGSVEILSVDCFIQQTSVQKDYTLICNAVTVMSGSIEGTIISRKWNIVSEASVNKGKLFAENGNISIPNAKVVNFSQLEAFNGKVSLKYAENSIIVGHEVEIEYAVNCLIIGDIIRVKNSTGCHFFGRRIFVEKIEFPPQARRKWKVILYLHDSLRTRKKIKASRGYKEKVLWNIELLQSEIKRLEWEIQQDSYKKAINMLTNKPDITEWEEKILKQLQGKQDTLLYYQKQLTEQQDTLIAIDADIQNDQNTLDTFLNELSTSIGLQIHSLWYSEEMRNMIKEYVQRWDEGLPEVIGNLPITFAAYITHDIPPTIQDVAKEDVITKAEFIRLILAIVTEKLFNDTHIKSLNLEDFLFPACDIDYAKVSSALEKKPDSHAADSEKASTETMGDKRAEKRLLITEESDIVSSRKDPAILKQKFNIPVKVDGFYHGYIGDITTKGLSLLIDPSQKYLPVFDVGEEVSIEFSLGKRMIKVSLLITNFCTTSLHLVKIGGYYVNLGTENKVEELAVLKMELDTYLGKLRAIKENKLQ